MRSIAGVAVLAGVLAGLPGTGQAQAPAPAAGDTVVGEVVRAFAESHAAHSDDVGESEPASELLTWIEPEDGEAVRVPTDALDDVPVGTTVEATIGGDVRDEPTVEDGLEPARAVLRSEVVAAAEPAPATTAAITNKVTVAMVRPGGVVADATTRATVVNLVNGPVAQFWSSQTGGTVQLSVTASYNWFSTTATCADPDAMWSQAAARIGFKADPGTHLLLYVPKNAPGCSDGLGTIGAGPGDGGASYVRYAETSMIAHELGHNFGLLHAARIQCNGAPETGTCVTDEYGDYYDVMGASWDQLGSLNPVEADYLGLFAPGQVETLSADGGAAGVTLAATSGTSGVRALHLVDPDSGADYYLEYRPAAGRDAYLGDPDLSSGLQPGVLLRRNVTDTDEYGSLLIDGSPSGYDYADDIESALPRYGRVSVAGGAFVVEVSAVTAGSATVSVWTASDPAPPTPIDQKYAATGGAGGRMGAIHSDEVCGEVRDGGCRQTFAGGDIVWSPETGAHFVYASQPRLAWYYAGQENGPLGYPTADTVCDFVGHTYCTQTFQGGSIYAPYASGTGYPVHGEVFTRYAALGAETGDLGYPTTGTLCGVRAGCGQDFQGGSVYWSPATGAHVVTGDVLTRYRAVGAAISGLGYPTDDTTCGLVDGGCAQQFIGGALYSSPGTGTRTVMLSTRTRYVALGGQDSALGYPTADTACTLRNGGCVQTFQHGSLYATSKTAPAYVVSGDILTRYTALGGANGSLGFPTGDTVCGLVDGGCAQQFTAGNIYWSPGTGARVVSVSERTRYVALGAQNSALGYPTADTACNLRGGGCGQTFEHGSLYATSRTAKAFVVSGDVLTRYLQVGGANAGLGYPSMDTKCGLRDGGCGQNFQGGAVYWTSGTGTHLVQFSIRTRYAAARAQDSALGYATSDTICTLRGGGCGQHFQNGSIYSISRTAPAYVVSGAILTKWLSLRHVNSRYGYPIGEAYAVPGGVAQRFQGGTLTYVGGRVR